MLSTPKHNADPTKVCSGQCGNYFTKTCTTKSMHPTKPAWHFVYWAKPISKLHAAQPQVNCISTVLSSCAACRRQASYASRVQCECTSTVLSVVQLQHPTSELSSVKPCSVCPVTCHPYQPKAYPSCDFDFSTVGSKEFAFRSNPSYEVHHTCCAL